MCITSYWGSLRRQILLGLFDEGVSVAHLRQNTYRQYTQMHTQTHITYWCAPVLWAHRGSREEAAAINTSLTFASPAVVGVIREMGGKEMRAIGPWSPHTKLTPSVYLSPFLSVCVCVCVCLCVCVCAHVNFSPSCKWPFMLRLCYENTALSRSHLKFSFSKRGNNPILSLSLSLSLSLTDHFVWIKMCVSFCEVQLINQFLWLLSRWV